MSCSKPVTPTNHLKAQLLNDEMILSYNTISNKSAPNYFSDSDNKGHVMSGVSLVVYVPHMSFVCVHGAQNVFCAFSDCTMFVCACYLCVLNLKP